MINITLKKLTIINFKGISSLEVFLNGQSANIYGANEAGKTTVFDAFTWLLTGKNSDDLKDFNIKTLKPDGSSVTRTDAEVIGEFYVDGAEIKFRRIFKEKWVKNRGRAEQEFAGHETLFYVNNVPCQLQEYKYKVDQILPENVFKLITNPLYFNSIKWQDRRAVLFQMAGNITDSDIASTRADFKSLLASISGKTLEEYKREIAAKKKKIRDDLTAIPYRIEELNRSLPASEDYDTLKALIDHKEAELRKVDDAMADASKAHQQQFDKLKSVQDEIFKLKTKANDIEFTIREDENRKNSEKSASRTALFGSVTTIKREIAAKKEAIIGLERQKSTLQEQIIKLRADWGKVNEEQLTINPDEFCCPACKREFEAGDVQAKRESLVANFNDDKARRLTAITERGKGLKSQDNELDFSIENTRAVLADLEATLAETNNAINNLPEVSDSPSVETIIAGNDELRKLRGKITELQATLMDAPKVDNSALQSKKIDINRELDGLKARLNSKQVLDRTNLRISQLQDEESSLARQLADLEGTEFLIDEFNKEKINQIEGRINGLFRFVTFKLFDLQINGGETETCETLYNGVPFSDLNTAGKIWAGIDIINALCRHYQAVAPIFLDNRESVTMIPETFAQVINLIVSPADKQLRVEVGVSEMEAVA